MQIVVSFKRLGQGGLPCSRSLVLACLNGTIQPDAIVWSTMSKNESNTVRWNQTRVSTSWNGMPRRPVDRKVGLYWHLQLLQGRHAKAFFVFFVDYNHWKIQQIHNIFEEIDISKCFEQTKFWKFLNCGPLIVFLPLKLIVRPTRWFEYDMPLHNRIFWLPVLQRHRFGKKIVTKSGFTQI